MSNIVIVKQNGSAKWGLPKGHMTNTCEQYFRCAKREMYDETGINLNNIPYIKYGTIILNERLFYLLSLKTLKKIYLNPKDQVEISDSVWINVKTLLYKISPEQLNKTLRDFVKLMQFQEERK
jgi:8-oxo-dGTP pyrophosphatase MutT (NUDIX family)